MAGRLLCVVAAMVIAWPIRLHAQLSTWPNTQVAPPWNAQQVFAPSPLPELVPPQDREPTPPEDMPVRKRQQPGYESIGIRAGSWMINPSILAGGLFDSNVFSSNTLVRSDIATLLSPAVRARTLWLRHGLDIEADAQNYTYFNNPGLNETDANLKGRGWVDLSHDLAVLTNFQAAYQHEQVGSLSSPNGAVEPTPYSLLSGDVTVRKEFNRLSASLGVRIDSYAYGSTIAQNGAVIDQSNRDGQIYIGHSRVDYTVSPMLGLFAAADVNHRNIRGDPGQPLDSNGFRALAGFDVAFTHLISGEFAAGYVRQKFVAPTAADADGAAYRAMLTWRPSRLVDVNFLAEQTVTQTSPTTATTVVARLAQLGVDYEFRRNVIFSVTGAYEQDNFQADVRRDNVFSAEAQTRYLLNRIASVSAYYKYTLRDSNISLFDYDKHQVGLNVTLRY
jgi:hypothetical protein